MMTISTTERDLYATVWASIADYAVYSPGEVYLPIFLDMIGDRRGWVLDAGCGSGKGAIALKAAGFDVLMVDVTREGLIPEAKDTIPFQEAVLWEPWAFTPRRGFDVAYCCDVLEHIPPQFTMLVVQRLLDAADRVFLSICNVPDSSGVWIGKPLHQTVQPFTWWRDSLQEIATVVDARDLCDNSVFLLERK